MTKPRPDQPGRCPSIDPHDTLQCTRAIHDDDQCQAGGIAWRKGSPRIEWDRERADRLQEEIEEYDAILTRQSDLLTRTVNALRGNPPPLTSWSHHDIPELAAEKVAEVARLTAERDALAARVAQVESLADHWAKRAASDYEAGGTLTWGAADVHFSAVLREALAEPIGQEVDLPLHRTEAGSALDTMGADQ